MIQNHFHCFLSLLDLSVVLPAEPRVCFLVLRQDIYYKSEIRPTSCGPSSRIQQNQIKRIYQNRQSAFWSLEPDHIQNLSPIVQCGPSNRTEPPRVWSLEPDTNILSSIIVSLCVLVV